MKRVVVVKYDPTWKDQFNKAKLFYSELLKGYYITIEHVGSTSVENLSAKPILDIDIIVNSIDKRDIVISKLEKVGYTHVGDLGISGREAFTYNDNNPHINWMRHHLYLCMEGSQNLINHLILRDYLRENSDAVEEYSNLKLDLAKKFPDDIDGYVEGKTEFIVDILNRSGMDRDSLENIIEINKK